MVMSMQKQKNLALKAEMVMKERIYHDPHQKYGGDDNHGKFEKVKEVAQGESSLSIINMKKVSNKNPMAESNKSAILNPPKTNNTYAKPDPIKCYRCNEEGHRSNEYPKRKSINIIKKYRDDDGEIYCGPDGEDEEEDCEQDESAYLMRRDLFTEVFLDQNPPKVNTGAVKQDYLEAATDIKKFTHAELKKSTRGFGEEFGRGEGGITAYKGILSNHKVPAVKQSINEANQGEAQFPAEFKCDREAYSHELDTDVVLLCRGNVDRESTCFTST
ncbi:hypothetical protein GH714_019352 [Hevea brasiliensis]|uniref:CCHC-type domain-containing protein n=1 Tax=Hevea brasiliensis TaxID=3981 RepID=A0A6A6L6Z0_HEVBR|nr:hypothetical protein GH714_019352 [Hevea brasiliensis]